MCFFAGKQEIRVVKGQFWKFGYVRAPNAEIHELPVRTLNNRVCAIVPWSKKLPLSAAAENNWAVPVRSACGSMLCARAARRGFRAALARDYVQYVNSNRRIARCTRCAGLRSDAQGYPRIAAASPYFIGLHTGSYASAAGSSIPLPNSRHVYAVSPCIRFHAYIFAPSPGPFVYSNLFV